MTFAATLRAVSLATAAVFVATSAQALTIPTASLDVNSIQTFSEDAVASFDLFGVSVKPLGNAYAAGAANSYVLPVTSITIGSGLKIASGEAKGSALEISRTVNGAKRGLTLANFKIDFEKSVVLADTTPIGGVTAPMAPVYSFVKIKDLAVKYKFPFTITADEQLGNLRLTPEAIETQITSLQLPRFLAQATLPEIDFGLIDIKVNVGFRKAVSTKAYVPAP
ncbi:MAG: hypothetical protein ACK4K3_02320 [Aquabacterium sp.]